MDVDSDSIIDQNLLLQFNCLGTTDRDDLVKQFTELIGNNADEKTASFFLEMNNWNLQAAVCSFFDYDIHKIPSMALQESKRFSDINMPPNKKFTVKWVLRNTSDMYWPRGCTLNYIGGNYKVEKTSIPVKMVAPYSTTTVFVESITPLESGSYNSQWQLTTFCGTYFGEILWIHFYVDTDLTVNMDSELSEELSLRMSLNDAEETNNTGAIENEDAGNDDCVIIEDRAGAYRGSNTSNMNYHTAE